MKTATLMLLVASLLSALSSVGCSTGPDRPTLDEDQEERRDQLVSLAKSSYDDAAANPDNAQQSYLAAYTYAFRALEIDYSDLGAKVIQAWSLLQLGQYADFREQGTNIPRSGARSLFDQILEVSPNEFRARQGMAVINFREHFQFSSRGRHFTSAKQKLLEIEELGKAYFAAQSTNQRDASERYDVLMENWNAFKERYLELWEKFRFDFYTAEFANVVRRETMTREQENAYLIGTSSGLDQRELNQEWEERMLLPAIAYSLRNFDRVNFDETLQDLVERCSLREAYWDRLATQRVEAARAGFKDLIKTAPDYFWARRDLGLVELTIASNYLGEAVAKLRAQSGDTLPVNDNFRQDYAGWRERQTIYFEDLPVESQGPVRRHFQAATEALEKFVQEEEAEVRRKQDLAATVEQQLSTGENKNVVTQGWLDVFAEAVEGIYSDRRSYRQYIILQLIDLYSNDSYGVRNENKALAWVSTLQDVDTDSPLHYFVKGVLKHKFARRKLESAEQLPKLTGEGALKKVNPAFAESMRAAKKGFDEARYEFALFLERSSPTQDEYRRRVSRERTLACSRAATDIDLRLEELKNPALREG